MPFPTFIDDATGQGVTVSTDNPLPVNIGSGDSGGSIIVSGKAAPPGHVWTRPANVSPYLAGDVVGSGTTAIHEAQWADVDGSIIQVISASLIINKATVPSGMSGFRLHFFDQPPAALADSAPFVIAAADRIKYCGFADLGTPQEIGGAFLQSQVDYVGRPIRLLASSFWFVLQTLGAYTPASGTEYRVRTHVIELSA